MRLRVLCFSYGWCYLRRSRKEHPADQTSRFVRDDWVKVQKKPRLYCFFSLKVLKQPKHNRWGGACAPVFVRICVAYPRVLCLFSFSLFQQQASETYWRFLVLWIFMSRFVFVKATLRQNAESSAKRADKSRLCLWSSGGPLRGDPWALPLAPLGGAAAYFVLSTVQTTA